jgi:TP901 family phage tail tape measure protein
MSQNIEYKITLDTVDFLKQQKFALESFEKNVDKHANKLGIKSSVVDKSGIQQEAKAVRTLSDGLGELVKTYAGVATARKVIGSGMRMESALAQMRGGLHGRTMAELRELENVIDEVAKKIPKTKEDITIAAGLMAQAIPGPIKNLEKHMLNVELSSAAFNLNAVEATGQYLLIQKTLEASADQMQDIGDKIAYGHMLNPTASFGGVFDATSGLLPTAKQEGIKSDDILALSTILASSGIDSSRIITGFRSAINEFGKSLFNNDKKSAVIFKNVGLDKKALQELYKNDKMAAMIKLSQAVVSSDKYKGRTSTALSQTFGTYGASLFAVLGSNISKYNELQAGFNSGQHIGSTQHASNEKLGTLQSRTDLLSNAFTSLNQQIFDRLNPTLKLFTDGLALAVNNIADFMKPENRSDATNAAIDGATGMLTAAAVLGTLKSAVGVVGRYVPSALKVAPWLLSATPQGMMVRAGVAVATGVGMAGYNYYNREKRSEIGDDGHNIQKMVRPISEKIAVDINVNDNRSNVAVRRTNMTRTSGYGI